MLPSASAAKNTARIDKSGDFVMSAVATAALVKPPIDAALRFVIVPVNTPPAIGSGAPASGNPPGSTTEIVPAASLPLGALANHGRPKPLLNEIPSGRLTDGSAFVTALGFLTLSMKAGLCALSRMI